MTVYQELRSQCQAAMQPACEVHTHPRIFRRVFRIACAEIPAYQADLDYKGMGSAEARRQFEERVNAKYRAKWPVHDEQPPPEGGPYGFVITLAVVLAALVSTVISWIIWKGLDALWDWWKKHHNTGSALQALATEAESEQDPEDT